VRVHRQIQIVLSLLLISGPLFTVDAVDEAPLPYDNMAPELGMILHSDYYDPDRFRPAVMVQRALRALEAAEVSFEASWADDQLMIAIGEDRNVLPAPEPADLNQAMLLLEQVRLVLDHPRFDTQRQRNLTYAMLNGALRSLDPHTVIFPPEPADNFAEEIEGEFFGIGAYLSQEDGLTRIDRVMPGLPADQAGIEDGDIILGVDGEKVVGLSLGQTVRRIKGPKGTKVTLTIERQGQDDPLDIRIVRDKVQIIVMRSFRRGDVGYVRMDEFNRNTATQLFDELIRLQDRGPLKAFVLDLRFNSGGLLTQAKMISDFFLGGKKEIVRTVSPGSDGKPYYSSPRMLLDVPMAVITGSGSASAAEILAGSLQLNDRAVVFGNTTFGKGSVQTIRPLRDHSQLKITIQEYQLRDGVSIQERGVEPDIALLRHYVDEDGSVDLVPYPLRREADDEFALRDHGTYEHQVVHRLGWVESHRSREDLRRHSIASRDFTPDQEATMVLDLIESAVAKLPAAQVEAAREGDDLRGMMLQILSGPIAARSEIEASKLAEALAAHTGLTWGGANPIADGQLDVHFDGPQAVIAGEEAILSFTITNRGDEPVGRLFGLAAADEASPFWESEVVIGEVPPGGQATATLRFSFPPRVYDGEERFTLGLFQKGQPESLMALPVRVQLQAQPRPRLGYSWELVEQGPETDGRLSPDESASVRIHPANHGAGAAPSTTAYVFKDNDHFVQLGEGRFVTDPIPAGGEVVLDVPITIRSSVPVGRQTRQFEGESVKLQLRVDEQFEDRIDGRYRASLFHTVEIPVDRPMAMRPVVQPEVELLDLQRLPGGKAQIRVQVEDDNLSFVSCFVGEDKVALEPASKLVDGVFQTVIELAAGVNSVRIIATDADDVIEVLPLRLWEDAPIEQAKVTAPKPQADVVDMP
jgi:carboxyl-terminal processing protease